MSPPGGTDARTALLDAARQELAEHGPGGVGLRAVARRAGLSHAAPGYFFTDRAGMLTALAVQGWHELADSLERIPPAVAEDRLARLGHAYVAFGLEHEALYDLMFTGAALHRQDPDLEAAQRRAIDPLLRATGGTDDDALDALMSWGLVHGLVTLARQRALPAPEAEVPALLHAITTRYATRLRG